MTMSKVAEAEATGIGATGIGATRATTAHAEAAEPEAAFWALHEGLPRQSAGSDATTHRLLESARPWPAGPRALDLGCGPGRASLLLAQEAGADVIAVDLHRPFLDELRRNASARGLAGRVRPVLASMADLPCPNGTFDLVWSEGSAYILRLGTALRAWRRLLAPGGTLVVTEPVWTVDAPAPAARAFWDEAYPLRTVAGTVRTARDAGYDVVATYEQPDSDWWTEYYDPLAARLDGAERARVGSAAGRSALDACRAEIALRRAHGTDYAYVGFVLRPRRA